MEFEGYHDGEPILMSPAVEIETKEGPLVLTWLNTRIRVFPDDQFNHIEVTDEDGNVSGIAITQEIGDFLMEADFPYQFDPIVDEQTANWFIQLEAKDLDAELQQLDGQD